MRNISPIMIESILRKSGEDLGNFLIKFDRNEVYRKEGEIMLGNEYIFTTSHLRLLFEANKEDVIKKALEKAEKAYIQLVCDLLKRIS